MRTALSLLFFTYLLSCPGPARAGSPKLPGTEDRCAMIELNHKYDSNGIHVFDQVIFWDRDPRNGKYHVVAWHLIDPRDENHKRPVCDNHGCSTFIMSAGRLVRVSAPLYRESYTDFDPEVEDRKITQEWRRPLGAVRSLPRPSAPDAIASTEEQK